MSDIKDFVIENGVLKKYIGTGDHVVIPDGLISIGDRAFLDCRGLMTITIPDSVTSICDNAFGGYENLTIHAHEDSYAAEYAKINKVKFEAIK